jgi:hypothetical protein
VPPRLRPRRGAWEGGRRARALAAACLAVAVLPLSVPPTAAAYPCGDAPSQPSAERRLENVPSDECIVPATRLRSEPVRERRQGSISGLTVFVLAVAGALLIPIGRNGIPQDPFGHDRNLYPRKETIR